MKIENSKKIKIITLAQLGQVKKTKVSTKHIAPAHLGWLGGETKQQ